MPVFGRPRGLSILAAVDDPNISGKMSRALRARAKVAFVQAGLSRSVFSALRLRFISLYLTFVRLAQADDMGLACARSKNQHVQAAINQSQCLKALFAIRATQILHDQSAVPLELGCLFKQAIPRVARLRWLFALSKLMSTYLVYIRIYIK